MTGRNADDREISDATDNHATGGTPETDADDLIGIESYILPAIGAAVAVASLFYFLGTEAATIAVSTFLLYSELRRAFLEGAREKAEDLPGIKP